MPCYYTGSAAGDQIFDLETRLQKQKEDLDFLTRNLCDIMKKLESEDEIVVTDELKKWWKQHKKDDLKRKRKSK